MAIKNEFFSMETPSELKEFQDLYIKSCDCFWNYFDLFINGMKLFRNIDETTASQLTSLHVTADQYFNGGTDYYRQAVEALTE